MGIPLQPVIREKKLSPGETAILIDSHSIYGENVTVKVTILSDDEAKVLVKTTDCEHEPGSILDPEKSNAIWFGGTYMPCGREHHSIVYNSRLVRERKQRAFKTGQQTIFSNGLKRIEWRPK